MLGVFIASCSSYHRLNSFRDDCGEKKIEFGSEKSLLCTKLPAS